MINVSNVFQTYHHVNVLEDFNLSIDNPMIIGMWGRNGAGKTTFMNVLSGQENVSEGSIEILGEPTYNNPEIQKYICYVQENHPFPYSWTVGHILKYGPYFYADWDNELANRLIDIFELPLKKKIITFSKGMKTAAQIVLGLASNSQITILDEPTNGLDAVKRKEFYDELLRSYELNPRIFIISSHHIEEIQHLCESMMVIHKGKLMMYIDTDELVDRGVYVTGNAENMNSILHKFEILEESTLKNIKKVLLNTELTEEIMSLAEENELLVESTSLQDYLVSLTKGGK